MFCDIHCPLTTRLVLLNFELEQIFRRRRNILCMLNTNHFAHIVIILVVARAIQDCGLGKRGGAAHQSQVPGLPCPHKSLG